MSDFGLPTGLTGGGSLDVSSSAKSQAGNVEVGGLNFGPKSTPATEAIKWGGVVVVVLAVVRSLKGRAS